MKLLEGRVARRIVGLFILSALVPIMTMAGVSFVAVSDQLEDQSRERLGRLTRNAGQSILQQLRSVETGLHGTRSRWTENAETGPLPSPALRGMGLLGPDGQFDPVVGMSAAPTPLSLEELDRLGDDRMVLRTAAGAGAVLTAAIALVPDDPRAGTLWAEVEGDSIWGAAETFVTLPSVADFCVTAGPGRTLHCRSGTERFTTGLTVSRSGGTAETLSHEDDGGRFLVAQWSFYPDADFDAQPWTVLVAEDVDAVFAATRTFTKLFGLSVLLAVLLVILLSNVQIRRTLEPLAALKSGTERIAAGDLESRVDIESPDEFGALATSFNSMASQLGIQFAQFEAVQAVGQATLATFERDVVVTAALDQLPKVSGCRSAAVLVVTKRGTEHGDLLWATGPGQLGGTSVTLGVADQEWMRSHPVSGSDGEGATSFFETARRGLGNGRLVAFPHLVKDDIQGVTIIEMPADADSLSDGAVRRVRQISDQLAVALEDVRLIHELEELSWGALIALARAIDAKSEWTWGHSERVTEMALALGRELGLEENDLDTLHRGGLLHDIGKIGIPGSVLDKTGRLTEEEMTMIQAHPEIGARILQPIEAFEAAIPLVRHHHEKWDGTGYPSGLEGVGIPYLTRILTVADAYDAIGSARPYREATSAETVVERIVADSGTHFDPEIVEALVRHIDAKNRVEIREASRVGA